MIRFAPLVACLVWPSLLVAAPVKRQERGPLVLENIPEVSTTVRQSLRQYQNTRSASFQGWLPDDDGMYIKTRFGDTAQIHTVEDPLGQRRQLTFFHEPVKQVAPHPTKPQLLFTKDSGGNETAQIYSFDVRQGKTKMLSDGESRYGVVVWNKQGTAYAYRSNERNKVDFDIYVTQGKKTKRVYDKGGALYPVGFDHSGGKLLVIRYVSINESQLSVLDLSTGKAEIIKEGPGQVSYRNAVFSKDGQGLYFVSDHNSEFTQLRYMDFKTKAVEVITGEIPWDIKGLTLSNDGKYLAFTANQSGSSKLYFYQPKTKRLRKASGIPHGIISGLEFHPEELTLGFTLSRATAPADAYSYDIEDKELLQWTASEVGGLQTSRFTEPELMDYPSFDQVDGKARRIPAYVYKPSQSQPGGHPVLVVIHGGPEGQYRPRFSSFNHFVVNELKVAVVRPNVRGSAGYGKNFLKLDNGFKREDSVKDIGALLDWIATQPDLNPKKVMVMGGSYGGYMVLASMIHFHDRLAGGIDVVGISNFVTFLKNTKAYRRDLRRVEYGDERDPKMRTFLERISPTAHAAKITKPMLIVQGLNDPRVPASEAEQIVAAMRKAGNTQVSYLLAKDEGHGFRKKSNRDVYYETAGMFIKAVLGAPGAH